MTTPPVRKDFTVERQHKWEMYRYPQSVRVTHIPTGAILLYTLSGTEDFAKEENRAMHLLQGNINTGTLRKWQTRSGSKISQSKQTAQRRTRGANCR